MAEIIDFPVETEQADMVFVCRCGSANFQFFKSGVMECSACGSLHPAGNWSGNVNEDDTFDADKSPQRYVVDYNSTEFARRSIMRDVGENTLALIHIYHDGRVRLQCDLAKPDATDDERARMMNYLQTAYNLIFAIPDEKDNNPCQLSMEV